MSNLEKYVEVALLLPISKTFIYSVPDPWREIAKLGRRVLVPLGQRSVTGYIINFPSTLPKGIEIFPLRKVFEDDTAISENLLPFILWTAHYYFQPIGEVIKCALPPGIHPRVKESYSLSSKGREALEDACLPEAEKRILLSLKEKSPGLKVKKSDRKILQKMLAHGWIEKKEPLLEQRVKEKKVAFLRCLARPENVRLTPRQAEALKFIASAGEVALADFRAKYPHSSFLIKKFKEHNLIEIYFQETFRQISWGEELAWPMPSSIRLTSAQEKAIAEISQALASKKFHAFLLHGVTGSGKTEVYLRAIAETIAQGRSALLLVPEISLTSQVMAYFKDRCPYALAILHSGLTPGERFDEWRRIKRGMAKLVIGARSAIFAPLDNLGLIIVDEEHDSSYKQEEKVLYHARDLALVRGKMENAVVVLGSATPSLESYYNVLQKKFSYLSLPERIDGRPLPEIQIVDMRQDKNKEQRKSIISAALAANLQQTIMKKEQALLFLNRRGFATFALCPDCGYSFKCPNCRVSLIYHLSEKSFRCHYCDYALVAPSSCPRCSSPRLLLLGTGTQRLEEEIKKEFPGALVGRLDRDTAGRQKSFQIMNQVRRGEINLLVGTQMITKGHDLPKVTLVGVLAADLSLNVPDFRASERTFQLLTQVAGRAGRGELPGKVIIQTYNPDHYSLAFAQNHDFIGFYKQEISFRKEMGYPPFKRLIHLRWEGNSLEKVQKFAQNLHALIIAVRKVNPKYAEQIEVLGPAPAPLSYLRGKHRYHILLKGQNWSRLHNFSQEVLQQQEKISIPGVRLIVDVDPINML